MRTSMFRFLFGLIAAVMAASAAVAQGAAQERKLANGCA